MENFYKKKFAQIVSGLEFNKYVSTGHDYHFFIRNIKYPIAWGFGLAFSTVITLALAQGFFSILFLSLVISFPMTAVGLLPANLVQYYLEKTNFKFFRRFKLFSSLQDSYFYICQHLKDDLHNPKTQYVVPHFYECLAQHLTQAEGRENLEIHIRNLKRALHNQDYDFAVEVFFHLFEYSTKYGERITYDSETEYDKKMLMVEAQMIEEFLDKTVESEIEKELEIKVTNHIKQLL